MVEEKWRGIGVQGEASYRVASKLKILKEAIKKWTKEEREKENEVIENILKCIVDIDAEEGG